MTKISNLNKKIKIYADGPELNQINKNHFIDGYTFNPSLFRKLGVKNYLEFCKKILKNVLTNQYHLKSLAMMKKQCSDKQ